MSIQIFLQGKIPGIEEFLRDAAGDFEGRAQWAALLSEMIPRALLSELGLAQLLLGSAGGGQFLVVLPEEFRGRASDICDKVSLALQQRTGGAIRLVWAITEDLGTWADIRKRLALDLADWSATPAMALGLAYFSDALAASGTAPFATTYRRGAVVGWSSDRPAEILSGPDAESAKARWTLGEEVPWADHAAPDDDGSAAASLDTLASRATGHWAWGVLRGDVDGFEARLRRSDNVVEHLQVSQMYRQFIVNELQAVCSLPEFWQNTKVLYASGQSFAVVGAWDSLIGLAREMQRIFAMFVSSALREYAGIEGKTISMAVSLASEEQARLESVYADAGDKLQAAKTAGRDSIWVLGRPLEWKQLADAADSKTTMSRLIRECGASRQFLDELAAFYRDSVEATITPGTTRSTNTRVEKPWRFYRRLNSVLPVVGRGRDYQKLRADLISDFTGRRASNIRLRPQGRVALEWARLETGVV